MYLKKRVLRIFPALIVVVLLTGGFFLLGPLVTTLALTDYFKSNQTWTYLLTIFLYIHYHLPGVFANNPYPNSVNGSLWTLTWEFLMYIVVLALGLAGLIKKRLTVIPLYFFVILLLPIVTVYPLPVLQADSALVVFLGLCS